MPIFWRCPECRRLISLQKKICPHCDTKFPRSNPSYIVQVCYKRKRKTATARTLQQAKELETRLKSELIESHHLGLSQQHRNLTFGQFYKKHYLSWVENQNKSFSKAGKWYFVKWILPALGEKKLTEITTFDIERIKTQVLQAGRAPRTAQQIIALIRAAFNQAKNWGFFSGENPASGVKIPRFDNRRVRFLTPEEARELLNECKRRNSARNLIYPMVFLALTTGMRAGEIFRLKVQDINFKEEIIHVRDSKSGENGTVFISSELKKLLKDLIKGKKPYEHVFTKPDGSHFKEVPDVWKNIIKDLKFNEGITDPREKVVFHTLRHTFCSWLAMDGVPLHVIKELARHKTIQMTERYAHLLPDTRRKAAEKVWEKISC